VSGTGWTASITPATAGTFYIWAEETATPSVQAVSGAVTVGGAALTYSLISGSGNGSLTSTTFASSTGSYPAINWTSAIAANSTNVAPNITANAIGTITAAKFWWDTNATGTTVGSSFGNSAGTNGNEITFYSDSQLAPPTGCPPAPTAGTYYGKYALYNSSGTLLGVFTTNAITVS
jgi:hypothetical protein